MCLLHVGLVNMSDWVLFLAVCLFVFHPMSKVLSLCSRCEWLVAVGCREWARFLHSLRGWLGGVEWRADISAQGTWDLVLHMRPCWKGRGASEVTQLKSGSLSLFFFYIVSHRITQFLSYINIHPWQTARKYISLILFAFTASLLYEHNCRNAKKQVPWDTARTYGQWLKSLPIYYIVRYNIYCPPFYLSILIYEWVNLW